MSKKNTMVELRNAWLYDIGYLRIANDLHLDPDMVKSLYEKWTKDSIDSWKSLREDIKEGEL